MTKRTRIYYTTSELEALAEARGCTLEFKPAQHVFSLRLANKPEEWCWLINPATGERVHLVRELDRQGWDSLLAKACSELSRGRD
ncbi:hypothetical protein [Atlantibacter hermannii]|uniref:hypothetical protein n=1 Tax=Atlantibacter hermannii TaxID=565 RepID=UPI002896F9E0|nr:hypothetical protein [Atlantibacter hermannii]